MSDTRSLNHVSVAVYTESGCDPKEEEYSMSIVGFIGSLDISAIGGVDDVTLVKECVEQHLHDTQYSGLPEEGVAIFTLKESGEWEDVFWHKYYVVENVEMVEY